MDMEHLVLTIVLLIIFAVVIKVKKSLSNKKDEQIKSELKRNLWNQGFTTSCEANVWDKNNPEKTMCFMMDTQHKQWSLADYRAITANTYSFIDLKDYYVKFRKKGTEIVKGEEVTVVASNHIQNIKCGIIESYHLQPNNCEYIEIVISYTGKAKLVNVCSQFIFFEEQYEFYSESDFNFYVASARIENAKKFENMLYEMLMMNIEQSV